MKGTTRVDSCPATDTRTVACAPPAAVSTETLCTVIEGCSCASRTRRRQHVVQRARFGVRVDLLREIGTLFAARRIVIDREAGRRHGEVERRTCDIAGEGHPSLECTIDDDVIVTQAGHDSGPVHKDAQLGVRRVDAIGCSARRGRPCGRRRGRMRGGARRRGAARGEEQCERRGIQSFAQFLNPLLLDSWFVPCARGGVECRLKRLAILPWPRPFTG